MYLVSWKAFNSSSSSLLMTSCTNTAIVTCDVNTLIASANELSTTLQTPFSRPLTIGVCGYKIKKLLAASCFTPIPLLPLISLPSVLGSTTVVDILTVHARATVYVPFSFLPFSMRPLLRELPFCPLCPLTQNLTVHSPAGQNTKYKYTKYYHEFSVQNAQCGMFECTVFHSGLALSLSAFFFFLRCVHAETRSVETTALLFLAEPSRKKRAFGEFVTRSNVFCFCDDNNRSGVKSTSHSVVLS